MMDGELGLHFDPFKLPSVTLADHDRLPHGPGVYFAIKGDVVLYVGKAINMRNRWRQHHRFSELRDFGDVRIAWYGVGNRRMLDALEKMCIALLNPKINGQPIMGMGKGPTEQEVLDVLFCYGEESTCWFDERAMPALMGWDRWRFEDTCARLHIDGRITLKYRADGSAHARLVGVQ